MVFSDLHVHSNYSDGADSVRDIVEAAIEKGLKKLCITDHSYTDFDQSYCIKKEAVPSYISEISALKYEYKDKIELMCGIELDYHSDADTSDFDFVIGSVHYIKIDDNYIPVDESADILVKAVEKYFDGDFYSLIELYYDTVADVVNKTKCDLVGHFDLITKFSEISELFDTCNIRYINAYKKAVDKLIEHNVPFEINTGAISRGYRTTPYPSKDIIDYIKSKGGKLVLSSDSHSKDTLCYKFNEYEHLI